MGWSRLPKLQPPPWTWTTTGRGPGGAPAAEPAIFGTPDDHQIAAITDSFCGSLLGAPITAPLAVNGSSRGYYLLETATERYFLKAYRWFAERPLTALTAWERGHLYEGLCFAALKYLVCSLESRDASVPLGESSTAAPLRRVDSLRTIGKSAFDAALEGARGRD
jgi:hypothetical protein